MFEDSIMINFCLTTCTSLVGAGGGGGGVIESWIFSAVQYQYMKGSKGGGGCDPISHLLFAHFMRQICF